MKERPIIFSGEMVRAILEGRKTQTRRAMKPQPPSDAETMVPLHGCLWQPGYYPMQNGLAYPCGGKIRCPYGVPGDHLWVRETFGYVWPDWCDNGLIEDGGIARPITVEECDIVYRATDPDYLWANEEGEECTMWKPSIFMPKNRARIWLGVVSVRAEQLQDITERDACAEGCPLEPTAPHPMAWFRDLWDNLNAKRGYGWDMNPWIWRIAFRRID